MIYGLLNVKIYKMEWVSCAVLFTWQSKLMPLFSSCFFSLFRRLVSCNTTPASSSGVSFLLMFWTHFFCDCLLGQLSGRMCKFLNIPPYVRSPGMYSAARKVYWHVQVCKKHKQLSQTTTCRNVATHQMRNVTECSTYETKFQACRNFRSQTQIMGQESKETGWHANHRVKTRRYEDATS